MLLLTEHKKSRIEQMCDYAKMYNKALLKIQRLIYEEEQKNNNDKQ